MRLLTEQYRETNLTLPHRTHLLLTGEGEIVSVAQMGEVRGAVEEWA